LETSAHGNSRFRREAAEIVAYDPKTGKLQ
jgi:hypothetical protein